MSVDSYDNLHRCPAGLTIGCSVHITLKVDNSDLVQIQPITQLGHYFMPYDIMVPLSLTKKSDISDQEGTDY